MGIIFGCDSDMDRILLLFERGAFPSLLFAFLFYGPLRLFATFLPINNMANIFVAIFMHL